MSQFRISLGSALVEHIDKNDGLSKEICKIVSEKILAYEKMDFSRLSNLSEENSIEYSVGGKSVVVTFYKKTLNENGILLVVQAAYKTLNFPNYISFGFIGKIIVDAIQVNSDGVFVKPDDRLFFEFM